MKSPKQLDSSARSSEGKRVELCLVDPPVVEAVLARRFPFVVALLISLVVIICGAGLAHWLKKSPPVWLVQPMTLLNGTWAEMEKPTSKQVFRCFLRSPIGPTQKLTESLYQVNMPRPLSPIPGSEIVTGEVPTIEAYNDPTIDNPLWEPPKPPVLKVASASKVVEKKTSKQTHTPAVAKVAKPKAVVAEKKRQVVTRPSPPRGPTRSAQVARRTSPRYPSSARRKGTEGSSLIAVTIAVDGRITSALVSRSSGHSLLDKAALAAVRQWKFSPALQNGLPISSRLNIPITFRLQ